MRARGKTGEKSGQGRNEPHPADIHVAFRLRERRIELGMSQQKLAAALGIAYQQVSKYEQAKDRISARRLYDLSRVLDVPVTFFFEGIVGSSPTAPLASGPHNDPLDPREATELFAAYRAIPDSVVRRRLRQLAKTFAEGLNGSAAAASRSQSRKLSRRVRSDRGRGAKAR
jgi:transcriptional regulator with XRE-family HTH domain